MARKSVQGETPKVLEGKWFFCMGWWLFPKPPHAVSALRQAKRLFALTEKGTAHQSVDRMKPHEILRQVRQLSRYIHETTTALYNAQPQWSLCDIAVHSPNDAIGVIEDFFRLVEFAAAEFCWTMNRSQKAMDWKRHSWKHTTFRETERIVRDVEAGQWLPPQLTLDMIGSFEEAQELFRRAERGEPEAVARVHSLFPSQADRLTAARHLFDLRPGEAVPYIPSVADLAAEYSRIAVRSPDSTEAAKARSLLRRLVSKRAAKGSRPQGGRPPSPHHEETATTLWMMCYAISKQLREVDRFLQKFERSEQKRRTQLNQLYPWIRARIHDDAFRFLENGNTRTAFKLAGKLLQLSASKVEKVVYGRRSPS